MSVAFNPAMDEFWSKLDTRPQEAAEEEAYEDAMATAAAFAKAKADAEAEADADASTEAAQKIWLARVSTKQNVSRCAFKSSEKEMMTAAIKADMERVLKTVEQKIKQATQYAENLCCDEEEILKARLAKFYLLEDLRQIPLFAQLRAARNLPNGKYWDLLKSVEKDKSKKAEELKERDGKRKVELVAKLVSHLKPYLTIRLMTDIVNGFPSLCKILPIDESSQLNSLLAKQAELLSEQPMSSQIARFLDVHHIHHLNQLDGEQMTQLVVYIERPIKESVDIAVGSQLVAKLNDWLHR